MGHYYDYDGYYDESEYAGTYVHDVEGWDDDLINSVLEGEPDAYWNIDWKLMGLHTPPNFGVGVDMENISMKSISK